MAKKTRHIYCIHIAAMLTFLFFSCGGSAVEPVSKSYIPASGTAAEVFAIQIGAFSNLNNAIRLTQKLQKNGPDSYYFFHESGLYKVRYGRFFSKDAALENAAHLLKKGIISKYYIVDLREKPSDDDLRESIVETARSFLGVSYRWGGLSSKKGFDCSGLTMTVYKLNGLELPRSSSAQWKVGKTVKRSRLKRGDLVFFRTSRGKKISHVGIYIGDDQFIHSPSQGKDISIVSLSSDYYKKRYVGGRRYF